MVEAFWIGLLIALLVSSIWGLRGWGEPDELGTAAALFVAAVVVLGIIESFMRGLELVAEYGAFIIVVILIIVGIIIAFRIGKSYGKKVFIIAVLLPMIPCGINGGLQIVDAISSFMEQFGDRADVVLFFGWLMIPLVILYEAVLILLPYVISFLGPILIEEKCKPTTNKNALELVFSILCTSLLTFAVFKFLDTSQISSSINHLRELM